MSCHRLARRQALSAGKIELQMLKRVLGGLVLASMGWVLWLGYFITSFASVDQQPISDVAVVLGAAVQGQQPSPVFRERINHAIVLHRTGVVQMILFTGGRSQGAAYAESEVARNYAIAQGVPASDILIETRSTTTHENLEQARQLMLAHRLQSAILVSDPLHMRRAVSLADNLGWAVSSSPTPTSRYRSLQTRLEFLLREIWFYQRVLLG